MASFEIPLPDGSLAVVPAQPGWTPTKAKAYAMREYRRQQGAEVAERGRGLLEAGLQGATFGFGDELAGVGAAAQAGLSGEPMGLAYDQARDAWRAREAESGGLGTAAQLAGGIATGGLGAGMAQRLLAAGPGGAGRAVAGAATGGGVAGLGETEDIGAPGQVAGDVATGVALGTAGAPVAAIAGRGMTAMGRGLRDLYRAAFEGNDARAMRMFREAAEASGMAPGDLAARVQELGPDAVAADLDVNMQRGLRGVTSNDPAMQREVGEQLDARVRGGRQRLTNAAVRTMNVPEERLFDTVDAINTARRAAAREQYGPIYDTVIEPTEELEKILNRPAARKGLKNAMEIVQNEGEDLPMILGDDGKINPGVTLKQLDQVKQGIDAVIEGNTNDFGRVNQIGRSATIAKKALVDYIDNNTEVGAQYRAARDTYAGMSASINAARAGSRIFKEDADETRKWMRDASEAEREMFRRGAFNAVRDEVESAKETGTAALRATMATPKNRRRLRAAFDTDEQFDDFVRALETERTYQETRNMIQGGSPTARIQQDIEDLQARSGEMPRNMGPMEMMAEAGRRALEYGAPEVTRGQDVAQRFGRHMMGREGPAVAGPVARGGAALGGVAFNPFAAGVGMNSAIMGTPQFQGMLNVFPDDEEFRGAGIEARY